MRSFVSQLAVFTGLFVLLAQVLALSLGIQGPVITPLQLTLSLMVIGIGAVAALVGYIVWLAAWEQEPHPIPRVIEACRRYLAPKFLWRKIGPLIVTFIFLGAFGTFKSLIPYVHPFALDGPLSDLDRLVLGSDAFRITHEFIGPAGTHFLDVVYGLWLPVWSISILLISLFSNSDLQRRFFISFVAAWVLLGIVTATLFSSAGPCFLALIGHPYAYRYADLDATLLNAPIATAAQHMLAVSHDAGSIGAFRGISAMPSMHIAVCTLLVAAARRSGRIAFAGARIFYALILLGSVHLGWHYLSDGVIGTLGALLIWRFTRRIPSET